MEQLVIENSKNLQGEIVSQGSKNSALPILAATVLVRGKSVIDKCPRLTDVDAAVKILRYLGCKVERQGEALLVDSRKIDRYDVPENLMHEMRSSIVFLGPLLSRTGRADLSTPGGCEIGLRPIDLHIRSVKRFGVEIDEGFGKINCRVKEKLKGCETVLSFPSVGATENAMLCACLAEGTSVIINSAREPEIEDLADFLNKCGAKISGAGTGKIVVEGVKKLHGCEHKVIPDRIMVSTYLACCAVCGGEIKIDNICPDHISPTMNVFLQSGCKIQCRENSVLIRSSGKLKSPGTVRTMPYPGFPTDFQAPTMTMASVADGTSVIIENIFESRFKHASELIRMGANIKVEGRVSVVEGVKNLTGASVTSTDLRGGSALVVAGLCAQGTTKVKDLSHIDRGCENFAQTLKLLGARIRREQIPDGEGQKS
ncbi:MAG: UDP-N-acetylglucosamine 1-carboxyvinyltransferase [Clostridia bacterium]|nr:UDP-N-acetylglucosamine 1-carboxyvinyltransferase [Clostridia bacterium]